LQVFSLNFAGECREFWGLDYKIEHASDPVAKFQGDRPTKLGDLALKKKKRKETTLKDNTAGNYGSGRPN